MSDAETPQPKADEAPEQDLPLPPPTFDWLVRSFKWQTELALGLYDFSEEEKEKPEPDLRMARHSIDILTMLLDKTRGNLTSEEHRLLENSLTELRFRYVQVAEERQKPK